MLDFRPVFHVFGLLLCGFSAAMAVPAFADAAVNSGEWRAYVAAAVMTLFVGVGLVLTFRPSGPYRINLRQTFLITTLAWVGLSFFGGLPFVLAGHPLVDSVFETVSGLTTTGSTVFTGLDAMPPGTILWRALLQWIGGVGIVVTAILLLPVLRVGGMQLFRTESSDKSEKVMPRAVQTALWIAMIYVVLSAACMLAFMAFGMSPFDSLCHSMAALSTGGYSPHDSSFGFYDNPAIHWTAIVFMIAGGLPFTTYIRTLRGRDRPLWQDSQVLVFLTLIIATSLVLALSRWQTGDVPFLEALRHSTFSVSSIVTTTGFVSTDYTTWGPFAQSLFFLLTFVGACTGSTAGGIKIFRFQVLWTATRAQIRHLFRPHAVTVLTYAGRTLEEDIVPAVLAFIFVYVGTVFAVAVALSTFGLDFVTALSGSATALGNVGPGLGPIIGPAGTFAALPDGAKWILSAAMLLGRLELFTVIVLFDREFWRL